MGAGQKILVQYAQGFADGMKSQLLIGHRFLPIRIGGALRFQGSLKIKSAFGLIPSNFISIEGEFRSALLSQDCDLAIASAPLRANATCTSIGVSLHKRRVRQGAAPPRPDQRDGSRDGSARICSTLCSSGSMRTRLLCAFVARRSSIRSASPHQAVRNEPSNFSSQ